MSKHTLGKCITLSSRFILAFVYIFSGIVKAFDPMGTAIKIEEYLVSFSLGGLSFLSSTLSILLSATELMIGLMLLIGLFKRLTANLTIIITFVFTLVTLYIYINNPVSDCGCFGDAIKLTNAETFYKNIGLLILSTFIWLYYGITERLIDKENFKHDIKFSIPLIILCLGIPIYSTCNIPPIDFLPYQIGVNIPQAMEVPTDAPKDEYKIKLVYRNIATGKLVEFSDTDTTWYDDTKWEFVETKTKLVSRGFTPAIGSFEITNENGVSVKNEVLNSEKIILLVFYTLDDLTDTKQQYIQRYYNLANRTDSKIAIVTYDDIATFTSMFEDIYKFTPSVYNIDNVQLKSMIRQSKGAIFLEKGTITSKKEIGYDDTKLIGNMSDMLFKFLYISIIITYIIIVIYLYNNRKHKR